MKLNMNALFTAAAVLAMLLDTGCGGTIDLAKLKETNGAGGPPSNGGQAGGLPNQAIAGGTPDDGVGGGGMGGHVPGVAGGGTGGYDPGVAGGGMGGYDPGVAGGGMGGYDPGVGGGGIGGFAPVAGSGGSPDVGNQCTVDEDCVECEAQTDPKISGCYIPCCTSMTAMTKASCNANWQSFNSLCPQLECAVECAAPPKPLCVSGSCIHGHF